ncbi:S9 family peptidase [Gracilimonas mengyeensis]|uniref:Dipeptidyl aminopeptidase/acylaminoacyl peptidase n=1 Tax=Gracilimonas mengyeensis TaxID=1302730 RepID=A0A521FAW8_9BACT|nr:S9 family peptidase [Gracilimonas mengyeensis]SMO93317.1 Dipeptidyl aminopeptidase/acylaminoacyl peptidase [Gracilimonas mengyeensis]
MKRLFRLKITAFFALWVFLLAGFAGKAVAQQGLTSDQLAKLKSVGSVYLSPDGKTAAYTVAVPADPFEKNVPASYHLYLLDIESGESMPFITGRSVSGVAFRPNHNSITYIDKQDGDATRSVYEISLNGGEAQKLFSFQTNISSYTWAPDGNHLAFRAAQPKEKSENPLPYSPEIYEENLTNTWAYIQNLGMDGHDPHRIEIEGNVSALYWSPDQSKIAVAAAPTPLVDDYYMAQQVYIVDHHSGEILAEVDHEGKLGELKWSPESDKIAMIAGAHINDPIDGRLKMVDPETGEAEWLKKDFKGKFFEQVEWANNNTLHYLASKGVWSEFGSIKSDGSQMKSIIPTGGPILKAFAHAPNGNHVFDVSTPNHPDEVYVMKKGEKSPERFTNTNPWLDEVALGEQEVVTFTTEDGFEIDGILIYPTDHEGQTYPHVKDLRKRYPLINVIHGGPEAHYSNAWLTAYSMPGQVAAAQGYAVFYPNYRGSTGKGIEFAMSSQGDLAGAEFDDIVEGVDYLIEQGIVDGDKVGVTGGSYGGYATAWMSTYYSDRFAAGVMSVGISNNLSKWGTSDIPEELYHVHARERIWNNYMDFLERSPIYHVDKAETPILIMHGKEDTRVDPGQSYELYRHIKTRTDTPVRLVLYPGEGHGNRNATARYDFNLRMMRWFNQYLKGDDTDTTRPDNELEIEEVGLDQ